MLSRAYPHSVRAPTSGVWAPGDYSSLSVPSPSATRGGLFFALLAFVLGSALILALALYPPSSVVLPTGIVILTLTGLLNGIEPARRLVGRAFESYVRLFRRTDDADT